MDKKQLIESMTNESKRLQQEQFDEYGVDNEDDMYENQEMSGEFKYLFDNGEMWGFNKAIKFLEEIL
jgi:hypothetical protein